LAFGCNENIIHGRKTFILLAYEKEENINNMKLTCKLTETEKYEHPFKSNTFVAYLVW